MVLGRWLEFIPAKRRRRTAPQKHGGGTGEQTQPAGVAFAY